MSPESWTKISVPVQGWEVMGAAWTGRAQRSTGLGTEASAGECLQADRGHVPTVLLCPPHEPESRLSV